MSLLPQNTSTHTLVPPGQRLQSDIESYSASPTSLLNLWDAETLAFPDLDDLDTLLAAPAFPAPLGPVPLEAVTGVAADTNHLDANLPQNYDFASLVPFLFNELSNFPTTYAPLNVSPPSSATDSHPITQDFVFGDYLGGTHFKSSQSILQTSAKPLSPKTLSVPSSNQIPLSPVSISSLSDQSAPPPAPIPKAGPPGKKQKLSPEEREQKSRARAIRNRQAAQDSRDKKRKFLDDLEASNDHLTRRNHYLNDRLESVEQANSALKAENQSLVAQLASLNKRFKLLESNPNLLLGALSSDPAAVASQQRILSKWKTLESKTRPIVDLKDSSTSTQAQHHPVAATIVLMHVLHSMIYLISNSGLISPLISRSTTLQSKSENLISNQHVSTPKKVEPLHTVREAMLSSHPSLSSRLGLLSLHNSHKQCASSPPRQARFEHFPVLRTVWAGL